MVDITTAQVVNDVIVFVAGVASLFGIGKSKKAQAFFGFLRKEEGVIVAGVEALAKTPGVKAVEAELHIKLDAALAKAKKSELGKLAAEGLHALGVSLQNASVEQLDALALHIATLIPGVSRVDIDAALQDAQKVADDIASVGVIKAANAFAQEKIDAKIAAQKVAAEAQDDKASANKEVNA